MPIVWEALLSLALSMWLGVDATKMFTEYPQHQLRNPSGARNSSEFRAFSRKVRLLHDLRLVHRGGHFRLGGPPGSAAHAAPATGEAGVRGSRPTANCFARESFEWVWIKIITRGPQVLVLGSIYQGSMLSTVFDPQPKLQVLVWCFCLSDRRLEWTSENAVHPP